MKSVKLKLSKSKSKSSLFRQGGPFSTRLVSIGALRKLPLTKNYYKIKNNNRIE